MGQELEIKSGQNRGYTNEVIFYILVVEGKKNDYK